MEGLAIARTRRHPYSIVFATAFVSFVEDLRRDFNNALKYSADAIRLADEDGFPVLSGLCGIVHGWARVHLDSSADGLSEIYSALEILKATGTEVTRSHNMWNFYRRASDAFIRYSHRPIGKRIERYIDFLRDIERDKYNRDGRLIFDALSPDDKPRELNL